MKKLLPLLPMLLVIAGCSDCCNGTTEESNHADIIFHHGTIVTVDEDFTTAEAIAIRGETILAVGENEEILDLEGPDTESIDLHGAALLPGFIDGHTHVIKGGHGDSRIDYDQAMDAALSYGLTTVNEMVGEASFIRDLQQLSEAGLLRLRVNVFTNINFAFLEDGHTVLVEPLWPLENGPILDHDSRIRVTGVKIFVDGAAGELRGCPALTLPYEEAFQRELPEICKPDGNLYLTQDQLNLLVTRAQEAGFSVSMHAMGDRAIDTTLNAIEYALNGRSNNVYRHAIQHSSWLRPDQIARYEEIRPLASVRGYFNTCEQDFYVAYYGPEREGWWANRFVLPNLGIHAYGEGDYGWGVDHTDRTSPRPLNPLLTLYGLVTHQQLQADGTACYPGETLSASERAVDLKTAVRMLTIEPAYAVFQEDYLGSLEPGKFADLIILSDNPLTVNPDDLAHLKVWMTMVGGKVEYCEAGHEDLCPIPPPEPVSINIAQNEGVVSAGTPVYLTFGWGCDTEENVDDFIAETVMDITVDGQPLTDTSNYWGGIQEAGDLDGDGDTDFKSVWSFPLGVPDPGTHVINSRISLQETVTDGFDFDEDGFPDEYSGLLHESSLQLTVEQ